MPTSDTLKKKLDILNGKSFAVQEGIEMLKQTQTELIAAKGGMEFWNNIEVSMNTMLIPLNIIVNAFDLKGVNGLYRTLVSTVYSKMAKSGTRVDGRSAQALSILKKGLVEGLKKKAPDYIPGVNILVGLAEDTLALYQSIERGKAGQQEARSIEFAIKQKMKQAQEQLIKLGIDRAQIYEAGSRAQRTA